MGSSGIKLQTREKGYHLHHERDWNPLVRQVNAMSNIGDDQNVIATAAGTFRAPQKKKNPREPDIIRIRNDTGGDLTAEHPILGIGDPIKLPDQLNPSSPSVNDSRSDRIVHIYPPAFKGATPTDADHTGKFAILSGPVVDGNFQTAVVSGTTWVRVLVNDEVDSYADVNHSDTSKLETGSSGAAHILWLDSEETGGGGDTRWALVRVGNPSVDVVEGTLDESLAEATESFTDPESANMSVYKTDGVDLVETSETKAIINRDTTLSGSAGDYVIAIKINGEYRPIWVQCADTSS